MPLIKILFFGESQELVGVRESKIQVDDEMVYEDLHRLIFETFPQLSKIESTTILAVDQEFSTPEQIYQLSQFSEIAVIPPLSGG